MAASRSPFFDLWQDPVLGQLAWEGYGDGDWWSSAVTLHDAAVQFRIGGTNRPDPALLERAHEVVRDYDLFRGSIDAFLRDAAARCDDEKDLAAMTHLRLAYVALFPVDPTHESDGYSGEFLVFERIDRPERPPNGTPAEYSAYDDRYADWRCDLVNNQPMNMRRWN